MTGFAVDGPRRTHAAIIVIAKLGLLALAAGLAGLVGSLSSALASPAVCGLLSGDSAGDSR